MRKGQVTVFVIVSVIVVAVIALFFVFRGSLFGENIPLSLVPVYSRYGECISEEASNGLKLMQSQGGRIDIGELSYASDFNPFSSHLNFLGFKIPYWYGFTGNNLVIENVPSVNDMENELATFISERLNDCDLSDFYAQGFLIEKSEVDALVDIVDDSVSITVNAPLTVSLGDDVSIKRTHNVNVNSKIGVLYDSALSIYNSERNSLFLENYALDVLQSYSPVDGVEIQCSPKIWKTNEVVSQIQSGLSANIGAVGFSGESSGSKYFTQNLGVNEPVNILYLPDAFPSKIEVTPASQTVMIAEPVGTQEGLGIMGFCYVPYHFVYDLRFPVLVQVGDGIDNFQFPMVVNIDNNLVSSGSTGAFVEEEQDVDVCSFAENEITVNTYDINLNPILANISYKCFDSVCDLGQSVLSPSGAVLDSSVPACVNGELIASATGYSDSKVTFSSNSESFAEIILEKEYSVDVEIRLAGQTIRNSTAVVHFVSEDGESASAIIPESSEIDLKEGLYRIEAFVYGNSNVIIPASRKTECFTINKGGVAGFFGSTKEECVNVEIPSTKIDYALLGGGKLEDYYILASELENGKIILDVSELPRPNSLEQLQYNYEVFNTLGIEVNFV
ncbi:MAG: hypothetical protein AABX23_05165 [Nanoarchaeota archaeon]